MTTAALIIGILILFFIVYSTLMYRRAKNMKDVPNSDKIVVLTKANFDFQIKKGLTLVDFWAGWCMPCKMLAPTLNEVAEEVTGSAKIGKVDVEANKELASKFGIRSIPTLILFQDGKEIKRFIGVKSKDFYIKQIRSV